MAEVSVVRTPASSQSSFTSAAALELTTSLAKAHPSPFGMAEPERMTLPALGNDNRFISPHPILILLNAPARVCGTGVIRTGAGRNF